MDIRLPSLGEGADSGIVANIFVKVGDSIAKGQSLLELESEKAVASIPSPAAGRVTQIRVKVGDKLTVGQVILSIADAGVTAAAPQSKAPVALAPTAASVAPVAAPLPMPAMGALAKPHATTAGFAPPASPTVRKLASDLGIDLGRVTGSEHGGRIVVGDLKAYILRLQQLAFQQPGATVRASKPAADRVDFALWGPILKKPVTPMRRAIADKMVEACTTIPHVSQFDEADLTVATALKMKYEAAYEKAGARLTLTPFILKAVVAALKKHPSVNASLSDDCEELILKEYYHLGIATDTEAGLLVPVLRDADRKSLLELAKELAELSERARQRKLSLDQMKGGTFTISNQGGIGGGHFTPIINKPEVAILGIGRGALKPVVVEGKVVVRPLLPLCLSYDHRVLDGANAVRFLRDVVQALEQFNENSVKL